MPSKIAYGTRRKAIRNAISQRNDPNSPMNIWIATTFCSRPLSRYRSRKTRQIARQRNAVQHSGTRAALMAGRVKRGLRWGVAVGHLCESFDRFTERKGGRLTSTEGPSSQVLGDSYVRASLYTAKLGAPSILIQRVSHRVSFSKVDDLVQGVNRFLFARTATHGEDSRKPTAGWSCHKRNRQRHDGLREPRGSLHRQLQEVEVQRQKSAAYRRLPLMSTAVYLRYGTSGIANSLFVSDSDSREALPVRVICAPATTSEFPLVSLKKTVLRRMAVALSKGTC
jgi:hypothetical protein